MQKLEYINVSYDLTEHELSDIIKKIQTISEVETVVLPPYFIKYARGLLGNTKNISCLVDFPMGMSDIKSRASLSSFGIKNLANYIDIVIPSNYLTNRKYDKIREDIKYQKEICQNIRYILEYRVFDHQYLKKMTDILMSNDLTTICISTGQSLDILSDAIIAAEFLRSQFNGLKTIISANFWNDKHFNLINNYKPYAIRCSYIDSIISLSHFISKKKHDLF
jgi:deoxyribose-phosphate aldolase